MCGRCFLEGCLGESRDVDWEVFFVAGNGWAVTVGCWLGVGRLSGGEWLSGVDG